METLDKSKLWYTDITGDTAAARVDRERKPYRPRRSPMSRYETAALIRRLEVSTARMGGVLL